MVTRAQLKTPPNSAWSTPRPGQSKFSVGNKLRVSHWASNTEMYVEVLTPPFRPNSAEKTKKFLGRMHYKVGSQWAWTTKLWLMSSKWELVDTMPHGEGAFDESP